MPCQSDFQSSYSGEIQTVQVTQSVRLDVNDTLILLRHVSVLLDKTFNRGCLHGICQSVLFVTFRFVAWVQKIDTNQYYF
jgi:hypothetical protein